MADRIRDRTLVLRVASPDLLGRLRGKMAETEAKAAEEAKAKASAAHQHVATSGVGAGGDDARGAALSAKDELRDLDGVTVDPSEDGSTLFYFRCDDKTYPARLVNLPCPVEVQKTHDHAMFYKCSDVGQILIVYEDEAAMADAEGAPTYRVDGFPSYYHSGLTPPMKSVVKRRFAARDHESVAPPREEVAEVEKELRALILTVTKDTYKGRTKAAAAAAAQEDTKIVEDIEEEVVDYEPWMDDNGRQPNGVKFDEKDRICTMHPEVWLPPVPREAAKKEKKEKKEDAPGKSDKQEKKKKKSPKPGKSKDKSKREAVGDTVPPSTDAPPTQKKKGIAARKNREVDEAMVAAVKMATGGEDGDEDMLALDDFFDFGAGDDFSGLEMG